MSILNIAYSALNAFQYGLDVTGNNIANAKTPGYSRQSIQYGANFSQRFGGAYIGSGVSVNSVFRNADQFAAANMRNTLSSKSQYDIFYQQASQIDKLLSQDGSSISSSLQSFFNTLGQLNNAPDSAASRGVALSQSKLLVSQFTSLQTTLDQDQTNNTAQIKDIANKVNLITADIAVANQQIKATPDKPELLDHRDLLLKELAQYTDLTVTDQGDGMLNVGIGNGEMLVVGTAQRTLTVSYDPLVKEGTRIFLGTSGAQIEISDQLHTGKLGGLLDYESNILSKTSQMIGQMAIGLAQKFNAQHQLGMDLHNQIGQNFFTDYNSQTLQLSRANGSATNTGTGILSVNISDISQTQLSDYQLVVSDAATNQVRLIRQSDGTSTTLNWSNNPPAPPAGQLVIDGMTINVDNLSNLATNDTYMITPTRSAAANFALLINDPSQIALASPVQTNASISNTGQGTIALGTLLNTAGINKQYSVDFISPTQFNLIDVTDGTTIAGPVNFTPNTDNVVQIPDSVNPSYSFILSGAPNTGDQFTAQYNQGGFGDNRNGLALGLIQKAGIFSNGNNTIYDNYSNLLSDVGRQTNQALGNYNTADVLHRQALNVQDSVSGINTEEEGAELTQLRLAYEAAGKLLEISSQMMQMLFEIMR